MVKVIGTVFCGLNKYGDFDYMINNTDYDDSLFIYNDNIESRFKSKSGIGNAIIRKYNQYSSLEIPRSAGISTGSLKKRGFLFLDDH